MTPHHEMDQVVDWVAETPESIAARLEGAKASQAQIRFTMGIMAVISMMMLIASYNAYLSYDYNWIIGANERQRAAEPLEATSVNSPERKNRKPASEEVAKVLDEQFAGEHLADWQGFMEDAIVTGEEAAQAFIGKSKGVRRAG